MIFILIEDIVIIVGIDKCTFKKTSFFGGSRLLSLNDPFRRLDPKKGVSKLRSKHAHRKKKGKKFGSRYRQSGKLAITEWGVATPKEQKSYHPSVLLDSNCESRSVDALKNS